MKEQKFIKIHHFKGQSCIILVEFGELWEVIGVFLKVWVVSGSSELFESDGILQYIVTIYI